MKVKFILGFITIVALLIGGWFFAGVMTRKGTEEMQKPSAPLPTAPAAAKPAPPPPQVAKPLKAAPTQETAGTVLTNSGIIIETNQHRAENGLTPLTINSQLSAAALAKAQDMISLQYFAHNAPNGAGPAEVVTAAGYDYIAVGENLALGNFGTDAKLVQAWMDSPGHKANILSTKFTEIGVAVLPGTFEGKPTWFAVQEFGKPSSACPQVSTVLKAQIENLEAQIQGLGDTLTSKKAELEAMPNRGPEYNEKVHAYNDLVAQYNALLTPLKETIAAYNTQVSAYNTCAKQ